MDIFFGGIVDGLLMLMQPMPIFMVVAGTVFGIVIGALPGLTSTMGVALLVPVTFGMRPEAGLALLGAIYCSSTYAGSISAILINIPGTPQNCCTMLDGYPMTLRGESARAIAFSTAASMVGGLLSTVALLFLAPPLAEFALSFGAQEYFLLALFGISVIASLSDVNIVKGFLSGLFGLFLSVVGMHPITGDIRFAFGIPELFNGLPLVVTLIGLYSIPEVISNLQSGRTIVKQTRVAGMGMGKQMLELFEHKVVTMRATIIGIIIGIIPGAGQSIAAFVAYDDAKRHSKHPETFGTGDVDGIIAPEASNNAVVGGSLIPALTLGVPGNVVSAVLLGGLMIQGLRPGPALFTDNAGVVYCFILSLFISNLVFVPMGIFTAKYCTRLIETPPSILGPLIIALAVIGSYAINVSVFDIALMLVVGLVGYMMKDFGVPREPLVLGLVLGAMAEGELSRAISLVHGSVIDLFIGMLTSPLSLIILALTVLSIWQGIRTTLKSNRT